MSNVLPAVWEGIVSQIQISFKEVRKIHRTYFITCGNYIGILIIIVIIRC